MSWIALCEEAALPFGTGIAAWAKERCVAIFNLGEQGLYALDNVDPASGIGVLSRGLLCDIQGEICVASPLYKQHYRLLDGVCLEELALKVQPFEVKNQQGHIWIRLHPNG